MIRRIYRAIKPPKPTEEIELIRKAEKTKRYESCDFKYKNFHFHVTDFLSVAYQIKEYFGDARMKFSSASLRPLIIDCGSNVGVSVIYFKTLFPNAEIIAFEPDPNIASCLKKNLETNKITGVEFYEKAIWKDDKGLNFGVEGADGGSVFLNSEKTIQIPSVRLKDVLQKYSKIDLLKLDIEGAEVEVIKDCANELKKIKYMFVEYHSWQKNKQELDELLAVLSRNGFRYYIQSIGKQAEKPFIEINSYNGMDVQLDIYAVNQSKQ